MNTTFLRTLTDIFYPRRCPVCDRAVRPFGSLVCETCQSEFVRIRQPYCLKCGKELSAETEEYCGDCMRRRHLFDSGRALLPIRACRIPSTALNIRDGRSMGPFMPRAWRRIWENGSRGAGRMHSFPCRFMRRRSGQEAITKRRCWPENLVAAYTFRWKRNW